jgi:hypothetical protein
MIHRDTRTATWWRSVEPAPATAWDVPVAPARKGERRRRAGLRQSSITYGKGTATTEAVAGAEVLAERPRDPVGIAWGVLWRYTVVGMVAFSVVLGLRVPAALLIAIGAGGVILGLWYRRGWPPALWRAAVLGWLAAATAGSLFFPVVLVAALAVVTIEPWLAARRQLRSRARRSRSG